MIHRTVQNGRVGVSSTSEGKILLQVDHGDTADTHQWARCSMTVEEAENVVRWLQSAIDRHKS